MAAPTTYAINTTAYEPDGVEETTGAFRIIADENTAEGLLKGTEVEIDTNNSVDLAAGHYKVYYTPLDELEQYTGNIYVTGIATLLALLAAYPETAVT